MARTAPAPDIPPIPGMCPSVAVLAGGGDMGNGSGGSAGDGDGSESAATGQGGENAEADSRGAPDYERYPQCGYASHPVDVVTGRAFTHPIVDLELPGPLPFTWRRMYSSKGAHLDFGMGHGWAHTLGWSIEVQRRSVVVWNDQGIAVDFPLIPVGGEVIGPWGWVLRRDAWGFAVDADDGVWHVFSDAYEDGKRYRLTAIEDRNKNRIALTYDDGRLVEVTDSAGRTIRVQSTREGRIASIAVKNAIANGQWLVFASYTYDDAGNLASVTDADGHASHYAYDDDHRMTSDGDRTGLTFHFRYDAKGRCIEAWGDYPGKQDPSLVAGLPKYLADGVTRVKGIHHCKFEYLANGYSEVADSTMVRRFFGNAHGTLDKAVDGGGVTTNKYSDAGHLLQSTDPLGATVSFERDARGRITKTTDALSRTVTITRDPIGLPLEVVDPAGGVVATTRDARGNLLTHTDENGAVRSFRRDERGLVMEAIAPTGGRTAFTYDAHGNRVAVLLANGATWRYAYDAFGRRVSQIDPTGAETRYAYSNRGDLVAVYDAAGGVTRYAYDGERHLVQITSPSGATSSAQWGGYNKLVATRDANGHTVRLCYNLEGELVEVHNERGEVHRLEYDAAGKLASEVTFDGRQLRYRNDALRRPIAVENGAGEKTELVYDPSGALVERKLADDVTETFEYNLRSELVRATSPAGEFRFERDATGRVIREVQIVGDEEISVDIEYDAAGRRVGRKTSLGHAQSFTRDAFGAITRTLLDGLGANPIQHELDALGREVGRQLQGGGRLESAFDPVGRLSQRRVRSPVAHLPTRPGEPEWLGARDAGVTLDKRYQYGWDSEIVSSWDQRTGSMRFEHDPAGQLLAALPDKAPAELFRFDAGGSIFEAGASAPGRDYAPGGRLMRKGNIDYRWDADGRLVEKVENADGDKRVWRYEWNASGFLRKVVRPDETVVEFQYDPFGRRVAKRISVPKLPGGAPRPVALTRFVWDGDALVHEVKKIAQAAGDPVVEERTYWFEEGGTSPIAHRETRTDVAGKSAGPWLHYVNDPLGTPERLVEGDGAVACELTRSAWGKTTVAAGASASTPIRFPGQYEDEETGLCYNRFRYYDADQASYLSPDPLRLGGDLILYGYVSDPTHWLDPLGLAKTGTGSYSSVGGHHIHAKSAFKSHGSYSLNSAFCISQDEMNKRGYDHQAMTNKQRECFAEVAAGTRPNTMAEHDKIAHEALVAGGATTAEATTLVQQSSANLTSQGVTAPTNIPWH